MNPAVEWTACRLSPEYFVTNHVQIYNATARDWRPFRLWPAQRDILNTMHD